MSNQKTQRLIINSLRLVFLLFASVLSHAQNLIGDDRSSFEPKNIQIFITDTTTSDSESLPRVIKEAPWLPFQYVESHDVPKNGALWIRFQVEAAQGLHAPWLLILRLATAPRARVFIENQATLEEWGSRPIGLHYPFIERYEKSRHLAFPLDIEVNEPHYVYLELTASNIVLAPLMLIKQKEFRAGNTGDLVAMGLVIGALTVMLLYNIGIFSVLREKTYFYYCVYVMSALLYMLFLTGIAPIYIWPDNQFLLDTGAYLFASLTFLTAIIFFRDFLSLSSYGGWILKTNNLLILAWSATFISLFFNVSSFIGAMVGLLAIITTVVGIYVSVYLSFKSNRLALIYLVSWVFLMWGTLIFILMIRGHLEYNLVTAYSQMLGMIVELVLLSYALAYRINLDREQTADAQQEALVLAKRVSTERRKRIVAQEETLSLQRNINEKLEKQVELRTRQYEDAMDKLEMANADLKKVSLTDQLSQVYNRRAFDEAVVIECKRARREKQNLAIILVDIDKFKDINDTLGHTFGDVCIQQVAKTLTSAVNRSGDMLARYGGEEFIFLLPNTSEQDAKSVAEKARKLIESLEINAEGHTRQLTASFGVASWIPDDHEDDTHLVKAADKALYIAKEEGRNCVRVLNRKDHFDT